MTFENYKESYDGAPYSLEGFAEGAIEVEDDLELKEIAENLFYFRQKFIDALNFRGIEIG
jgi:hypothetical protein